jgi:hypothetical protein
MGRVKQNELSALLNDVEVHLAIRINGALRIKCFLEAKSVLCGKRLRHTGYTIPGCLGGISCYHVNIERGRIIDGCPDGIDAHIPRGIGYSCWRTSCGRVVIYHVNSGKNKNDEIYEEPVPESEMLWLTV